MLATLLTELDGVQSADGVIVVAATNRPEKLDPALLRPGRLDLHICVSRPDHGARCEILAVHLHRLHCDSSTISCINILASQTVGWSGAELENLCREAAMVCLREYFGNGNVNQFASSSLCSPVILQRHLSTALSLLRF